MSCCQNPTITNNDSTPIKNSINKNRSLIRTFRNIYRRTTDDSLLCMNNHTHNE